MADLKIIFVFSCVFALLGLSHVEASIVKREVETATENNEMGKIQQQLLGAFDSLKKSMEDLVSKLNSEDLVQGVQNLTAKIEGYAKQAADQFASTTSGTTNTENKNVEQPLP